MIGIMKRSDPSPPRRICGVCGGKKIPPKEDKEDKDDS